MAEKRFEYLPFASLTDIEDSKIKYREYLKTYEWKILADRCKFKAGDRCQLCYGKKGLEAHHRTYDRLYRERDEDLTCLCADCHKMYHNKHDKPEARGKMRGDNY